MCLDGAGNLYVADQQSDTIRKIILATGVVSTIAGQNGTPGTQDGTGTNALFNFPTGLALDNSGELFVTDGNNNTIRKIIIASGVVTTFAGLGGQSGSLDGTGSAARFSSPQFLAIDNGALFESDAGNRAVRKIDLATAVVTTLAGGSNGARDGTGSAAQFTFPQGLALDGSGNLYVDDALGETIRRVVTATGVVTTIAGQAGMTGTGDGSGANAQFSNPIGIAFSGANLYISDGVNGTIRALALATSRVTTIAGLAGKRGTSDSTSAYCADFSNDANNCGACAVACAAGFGCQLGACVIGCDGAYCASSQACYSDTLGTSVCLPIYSCNGGTWCCDFGSQCTAIATTGETVTYCDGSLTCDNYVSGNAVAAACVLDFNTDIHNCGVCGNDCIDNDYTSCIDGSCVGITSDPNNCGGIGVVCGSTQACCDAVCIDVSVDDSNCGGCGLVCATNDCAGGLCGCGAGGVNLSSNLADCGACGQRCTGVCQHGQCTQ